MVWSESDLGLSEAAFQDWVRTATTKAGLSVRELAVNRAAGAEPSTPPRAASAPTPGTIVKARLSAEFKRLPLAAFLSEVAQSERVVVVDRLLIRTWSQPATVEIDLRILAAAKGAAK
jgi:hypothetical protein